jgi:hypothetical protein
MELASQSRALAARYSINDEGASIIINQAYEPVKSKTKNKDW